jgi:hypothetical protein
MNEMQRRLLSGMSTTDLPFYNQQTGEALPEATEYVEGTKFDSQGRPIPIAHTLVQPKAVSRMMTPPSNFSHLTDEQVHEAAAAGEAWKKELQRWMSASAELARNMKKLKIEDEQKMQELAVERAVVSQGMLQVKQETQRDTEGRGLKGYKPPAENTKPGWTMAEGTNFWSVNEKDPYWQTKQGHDEAVALYGFKPGWVSNPVEQENQFVDLQPTKRISL